MALSMTVSRTVKFAGNVQMTVYCRVAEIRGNMKSMAAHVEMLHNDGNGELVDTTAVLFVPSDSGDNPVRQAYLHLKTMPEFAGATDC